MSVWTMFLSPYVAAFPDDVDDPLHSKESMQMAGTVKHNFLGKRIDQFGLDDGDLRTIDWTNDATSKWKFIIAKVVGEASINTTGLDTDGVTAITAKIPAYGTAVFPGIAIISTYNVSQVQVEGLADGTTVQLFGGEAAADNNASLDTYE